MVRPPAVRRSPRKERSSATTLARQQSQKLRKRYEAACRAIHASKCAFRLESFEYVLGEGSVAINTTLSTCVSVLTSGRFKTVFDVVAESTGTRRGPQFERALKSRLGRFYGPRRQLERLLHFRGRAKYGALHVGGEGPDYGPCCIVLRRGAHVMNATCFAGDSITAIFDAEGALCASRAAVLERFACRERVVRLAVVHHAEFIADANSKLPIETTHLQDLLCDRQTLLEIHLHSDVSIDEIEKIVLAKRLAAGLGSRMRSFDRASEREQRSSQYDDLRTLLTLKHLAHAAHIPVMFGGDGT